MSIEDSGFESEDQIFYSDVESELSFEILQIENIGHYNNNLQLAFMQNNLPVEINPSQFQSGEQRTLTTTVQSVKTLRSCVIT